MTPPGEEGPSPRVLIDAPLLLGVGDAMALAAQVDAVLVVTRLRGIARKSLNELTRVLERLPDRKVGLVLTGAGVDERDGDGDQYGAEREQKSASDGR